MNGVHLRKYGVETTIDFELFEVDGVDFRVDAVHGSGDSVIMKDEGTEANTTNGFTDEGTGYSLVLTATEMQAARVVVYLVDQTATKVWLDKSIVIETYGHASAMHAMDFDDAVRGGLTALPNAAAEAAGGLYTRGTGAGQINQDGNGRIDTNIAAISADTTAADNLEAMYDGTGYTDETGPASRSQVDSIGASSGGALNFAAETDNTGGAIKSVTFVGSQTNTYTATEAEDGTLHTIDDTGNAIDIVYQFDVGGARTGVEFTFKGYLNSGNDALNVQVYDFVGADWETRTTLNGQSGTANVTLTVAILGKHTGTGADLGNVLIRFQNTGQSNPQLNVDELLVAAVDNAVSVGYEGGAVWLDTNASNTGTEPGTDGVADNPVSTIAAATTLLTSTNLAKVQVVPGSSVTLAQGYTGVLFTGINYTLDFGGQALTNCTIKGATLAAATLTGTGNILTACIMDANLTLPALVVRESFLGDMTITLGVGDYYFNHCIDRATGTAAPNFDYGAAIGNTNLNIHDYAGAVEIENIGDNGTDDLVVSGPNSRVIFNANCSGGTALILGGAEYTDNSGNVTVTESSAIKTDTAAVKTITDQFVFTVANQVDANMVAISDDATAATVLEALMDGALVVQVNVTSSTTTAVIDGFTSTRDDQFNGRLITVLDGAYEQTDITDYVHSTQTLTFTALTSAPADNVFMVIH